MDVRSGHSERSIHFQKNILNKGLHFDWLFVIIFLVAD